MISWKMNVAILLASSLGVAAYSNPVTDVIGIYFDEEATVTTAEATHENPLVYGYLIMTNPSGVGSIVEWEAAVTSFHHETPHTAQVVGSLDNGINHYSNLQGTTRHVFDVSIINESPLPVRPTTILAKLLFNPHTFADPIKLHVERWPSYVVSNVDIPMNPPSGNWDRVFAVINDETTALDSNCSWGEIKSLYRQ